MTVYFHGNFGLNRPRMAALLRLALENPDLRDKDLAKPFGYGAPFAQKYRSWLHKTGLIELRWPVRLTPQGEMVYQYDPQLETIKTQWFIHWELTTDPQRAEAWHYFIHEFLPEYPTFTKDELLMGVMQKLRAHSEKHFGPDSKLNPVIVRKLIESYTNQKALGDLGCIQSLENGAFETTKLFRKQRSFESVDSLKKFLRSDFS